MFIVRAKAIASVICLTVALQTSQARAAEGSGARLVLAPATAVSGKTQGEWSAAWWQWAYSFDEEHSPVADLVGDRCGAGQNGPVWFLAGVFGSGPVKRQCTIPAGKYLFFPIINYSVYSRPPGVRSCEGVTAAARNLMDHAANLSLIVDGEEVRELKTFRQVSPACFNGGERAGRNYFPTAANGYFAMLKPLAAGRHTLKWGGELDWQRQAVVYELTVME
jgi:hypothetical protein